MEVRFLKIENYINYKISDNMKVNSLYFVLRIADNADHKSSDLITNKYEGTTCYTSNCSHLIIWAKCTIAVRFCPQKIVLNLFQIQFTITIIKAQQ